MKCKVCVEEGKRSRLHILGQETPRGCIRSTIKLFFDEDGIRHHHSGTRYNYRVRCDNKHAYVHRQRQKCPVNECEWNKEE